MAKGSVSKDNIIKKLLEVFPGSFVTAEGKELRIPMTEDGASLEIKVALTCAKDLIGGGQVSPGVVAPKNTEPSAFDDAPPAAKEIKITEDEAANVRKLMAELNL